jgi:hypothetical protein
VEIVEKKELTLDIQKIVVDLKSEKDRLDRAIAVLEATDSGWVASKSPTVANPRISVDTRSASASKAGRALTEEGRKRLSESMKKRWAERRKKGQAK